jgi:hypothetical protein
MAVADIAALAMKIAVPTIDRRAIVRVISISPAGTASPSRRAALPNTGFNEAFTTGPVAANGLRSNYVRRALIRAADPAEPARR